MIGNEIPKSNLQMHRCEIEHVYDSGMIDARSERGRYFERITTCTTGVDGTFALGDQCIVLTDGAQHFAIGTTNRIRKTDEGETVHDFDPGFMDWNNTKVISADDAFGSSCRLYVSSGGGVIIDTGEWCVAHYSPGNSKLLQYLERLEVVMPAHHTDIDHDGEDAEANYEWQTKVDPDAMERRLKKKGDPKKNKGHTLTVNIKKDGDAVAHAQLYDEGESVLDIQLQDDGSWVIDSNAKIELKADNDVNIISREDGDILLENQDGNIVADPSKDVILGRPKGAGPGQLDKVVTEEKLKREVKRNIQKIFDGHVHLHVPPLIPLPLPTPVTAPVTKMIPLDDVQSKNVKANNAPDPSIE